MHRFVLKNSREETCLKAGDFIGHTHKGTIFLSRFDIESPGSATFICIDDCDDNEIYCPSTNGFLVAMKLLAAAFKFGVKDVSGDFNKNHCRCVYQFVEEEQSKETLSELEESNESMRAVSDCGCDCPCAPCDIGHGDSDPGCCNCHSDSD